MGPTLSTEKAKLEALQKETKYTVEELEKWYTTFGKEYPDGHLNQEQFVKLYKQFHPKGNADEFAKQNFRVFDLNDDGKVSFREFMIALGVQCRGTTEQKMDWMFKIYDVNGNGVISREEMATIMEAIYKMTKEEYFEKSAGEHVDKIFKKLDKNQDSQLTREEFTKLGNTDPKLTDIICGFSA